MAWLTKSRFLAGEQCRKRLWFEVHEPLEVATGDSMPLLQGRAVDQTVQQLEPGPVVPRGSGLVEQVEETRKIFASGAPSVMYQAAFRAGPLAAAVDVLRRVRGAFDLVEVKATTGVKEQHLPDIAFQALVLKRARVPVRRAAIGHLNPDFILKESGNYHGLMTEEDVTKKVREVLPAIAKRAARSVAVLGEEHAPEVSMGPHCEEPYLCPFAERCMGATGPGPEYPVWVLPRGGKLIAQLAGEGFEDIREVPAERLTKPDHQRVHAATVSGEPWFDAEATAELRALAAPFTYLDFETLNFAVPEVVGTRPYEQWPFQWSVHVEGPDGSLDHHEYLAENFGVFEKLTAALVEALPARGPIFVYNRSLEAGVLQNLARHVPAFASRLQKVIDRLVDLLPIARSAYYHPEMKGSWSLKDVLPTIERGLGYEGQQVQGGQEAQLAFVELREASTSAARQAELIRGLKAYCERDTYGLVVLRRFLCGL